MLEVVKSFIYKKFEFYYTCIEKICIYTLPRNILLHESEFIENLYLKSLRNWLNFATEKLSFAYKRINLDF